MELGTQLSSPSRHFEEKIFAKRSRRVAEKIITEKGANILLFLPDGFSDLDVSYGDNDDLLWVTQCSEISEHSVLRAATTSLSTCDNELFVDPVENLPLSLSCICSI
jgi:hypothetical protein